MSIPSVLTPIGTTLRGAGSWFGGPHDSTDSGHTASGIPESQPGIAIYNQATLHGWWRVTFPNGRTMDLQQTDLGPSAIAVSGPYKGQRRQVDFLYSALAPAGYSETTFPTDAAVSATYLGKNPNLATSSTSSFAGASSPPPRPPIGGTSGGGGSGGGSSWFDTLIKWVTYLAFIGGGAALVWYGTKTVMQPRQTGGQQ